MNSDFQSLSYSYLEGDDLVNSPDVASIIEKGEKIVECLGGDGWNKTFISNAPKEDKEKTMENVAKVRFFIDSVLGLKNRLALGPINESDYRNRYKSWRNNECYKTPQCRFFNDM